MMTRLISWLFFITLALAGLALLLPSFIDWSRHKDILISDLSARLGQDIRIDGGVSLRLLPNPHLSLEKVVIGSPEKNHYLISLETLDARMSMDQLLHGQFVIDQINLQEPVINIFTDQSGSNWRDFLSARTAKPQDKESSGKLIALKNVTVSRGSIVYHNQITGQKWSIPRINMTIAAENLTGPYQARGDMTYGEAPLTFTFAAQAQNEKGGLPFSLEVIPIEDFPQTKVSGVFSPQEQSPLAMTVEMDDGAMASLFAPFDGLSQAIKGIAVLTSRAQASFKLAMPEGRIALHDLKVTAVSGETLAGEAVYDPQRATIKADVVVTKPALYWLSYNGTIDVIRKQYEGVASLKIEDISKLVAHAPAISSEVSGELTYASNESWAFENTKVSLPEWQGVVFDGRIQRVNEQTVFALAAAQIGIASDVSMNGQLSQNLNVDGRANVFGRALPFTLSGAPERPELNVTLADVEPQDILSALSAAPKGITFEGGAAAFKGRLDLEAASLSQALIGTVSLAPQKLKITNFSPAELQSKILSLDKVPDDLAVQLLTVLSSAEGNFAAKPIAFELPAKATWSMKGISYEGGSLDFGTAGGESSVSVTASDDTKVIYKGKLPLGEKDMPLERATAFILERNPPAPAVDTKAAVSDILNRLGDEPLETAPVLPAENDVTDETRAFTPPADSMPPQPAAPLQEIEIEPAPALPDDTPLAVDLQQEPMSNNEENDVAPLTIEEGVPDEIFPLEKPNTP